jgi:hypothetical protein
LGAPDLTLPQITHENSKLVEIPCMTNLCATPLSHVIYILASINNQTTLADKGDQYIIK